jgi:hypothetical protein
VSIVSWYEPYDVYEWIAEGFNLIDNEPLPVTLKRTQGTQRYSIETTATYINNEMVIDTRIHERTSYRVVFTCNELFRADFTEDELALYMEHDRDFDSDVE